MKYVSTRGRAPEADFESVLMRGLAPDGGLYVPAELPALTPAQCDAFAGQDYAAVAAKVLKYFVGDTIPESTLQAITKKVYAGFDHSLVAPLTQVGDEDWILELFHGPTLAFKDFAMQLLGALFDLVLGRRGDKLTIIAATSGDTGAAAIHALAPCEHVNVVVLHPEGRVTDVQRRMMTTVDAPNVMNIAVSGDFDACQAIVKTLFADRNFVERVNLSGVNSINWARLAAQTIYYFSSAASLSASGVPIHFVVPTGNFGDVYSGYVAKRMGLNAGLFGVATNSNDILHRAISTGDYSPLGVRPTISPSMDIQVASNFERLLYDALGRDGDATRLLMEDFGVSGKLMLSDPVRRFIAQDFVSCAVDEATTQDEMRRHYEKAGAYIDPHTGVARAAARRLRSDGVMDGRIITLSTAHPAKFPDAVKVATGMEPALTPAWEGLFARREKFERVEASANEISGLISDRYGDVRA